MFFNFIYLLTALFVFTAYMPGNKYSISPLDPFLVLMTFMLYYFVINYRLRALNPDLNGGTIESRAKFDKIASFSMLASIAFFFVSIFFFHLKEIIIYLSFFPDAFLIHDIAGLGIFHIFLYIHWKKIYYHYERFFNHGVNESTYIRSRFIFNLSILAPWFIFSLLFSISELFFSLSGIKIHESYMEYVEIPFFFVIISLFLPVVIQKIWGCRTLPDSQLRHELMAFCKENGLKFKTILLWNIFDGKLFTAGIMGLIKRFRYVLITPVMLTHLTLHELKSVLAHELGHSKNHHIFFYFIFIFGFLVLTMIYPEMMYLLLANIDIIELLNAYKYFETGTGSFSLLCLTIPLILFFIVYYRLVFGFISRAFEREADIHSLQVMGDGKGIINSLEKIGVYAGNIREIPNWHHYSIKERVDFINECSINNSLVSLHKKKVKLIKGCYILFLSSLIVLTIYMKSSGLERQLKFDIYEKLLQQEIVEGGSNFEAYFALANLYFEERKYSKTEELYLNYLNYNRNNEAALNNLAWLYVTADQPELQKYEKALNLILRALEIKRASYILDTAAECYFKLGDYQKAVELEKEALEKATGDREFFKKQLRKFAVGTGHK